VNAGFRNGNEGLHSTFPIHSGFHLVHPLFWSPHFTVPSVGVARGSGGSSPRGSKIAPNFFIFRHEPHWGSLQRPFNLQAPVTGHFGHKTLRHQDTSDPHETLQHRLKTLLHQKPGTRHFGIRSTKSRDTLDLGQFRQNTAPPLIRLKVGAEVSWCRNVLWPKCPAPQAPGMAHDKFLATPIYVPSP